MGSGFGSGGGGGGWTSGTGLETFRGAGALRSARRAGAEASDRRRPRRRQDPASSGTRGGSAESSAPTRRSPPSAMRVTTGSGSRPPARGARSRSAVRRHLAVPSGRPPRQTSGNRSVGARRTQSIERARWRRLRQRSPAPSRCRRAARDPSPGSPAPRRPPRLGDRVDLHFQQIRGKFLPISERARVNETREKAPELQPGGDAVCPTTEYGSSKGAATDVSPRPQVTAEENRVARADI